MENAETDLLSKLLYIANSAIALANLPSFVSQSSYIDEQANILKVWSRQLVTCKASTRYANHFSPDVSKARSDELTLGNVSPNRG